MSNVWLTVPSARPLPEVEAWTEKWKAQGYRVALWRDTEEVKAADMCIVGGEYPGWPVASNRLIAAVFNADPSCDWVVCGGDDTLPDPHKRADEIAFECGRYFGEQQNVFRMEYVTVGPIVNTFTGEEIPIEQPVGPSARNPWSTFGVMQPTGDRWGDDAYSRSRWPDAPAMIDRICGSPWIGREFALRINGGQGPWWPEYFHNWADEEMQCVAKSLGVLWQRRDLTHFHNHARRDGGAWQPHQQWFDADYRKMSPLFAKRKAEGFPGSAPL